MIRWGIIGCGAVCEVKSGPGFQRAEGSALVAVMRRDAAAAADFARRHQVPRWYDDASRLIADPEVDAVYVATSVDMHEAYALQVAAAGKPCYVEKPMARNHAECQRLVATFAARGLPLFVAYYRRALPRFLAAGELVRSGRLGTLTGITYRYAKPRQVEAVLPWRLRAERAGAGLFVDVGSHALDIIAAICGDLADVSGQAANCASAQAVEDSVVMTAMAGGVPLSASWNFASFDRDDRLLISGTKGNLETPVFADPPLRLTTAAGCEELGLPNPPHIQQPLIQTIVDQLHGRGHCPSTGQTAAQTSLVMDRVLASYYGGREDGFWNREATWPGRVVSGRGHLTP